MNVNERQKKLKTPVRSTSNEIPGNSKEILMQILTDSVTQIKLLLNAVLQQRCASWKERLRDLIDDNFKNDQTDAIIVQLLKKGSRKVCEQYP